MKTERNVRDEHALRPDEEVLANIERGHQLMREPEGIDLDAIVKHSMAAYWAHYDERALEADFDPALNWRALSRLSTWGTFVRDLSAGPAIVGALGFWALANYGFATTWTALRLFVKDERFLPMIAAFVIASAFFAWMYRNGKAREYIGAFASCAFVAVVIGGFSHAISVIETMRDLARTQLEQTALNLMANHAHTGQFDRVSVTGDVYTLSTDVASKDRGVYHVTAAGVPGRITANVLPFSGTVTWAGPRGDHVANLFTGQVTKADGDLLQIEDASGHTVDLKRGSSSPFLNLHVGNLVMGAYDTKTKETSVLMSRPRPEMD